MARSVLVTGGNRGIGLAVARAFAAQGDNVAITYRSGEPPAGFLAVKCDVTDASSVDAAIAEIAEKQGAVEVVVANAGITRDTLLMRMTDDDFTSVLDANLTGAFRVIRAASKAMVRSRKGSIVLMSSVVAMTGSAGQANYAASKAGMVGLARSLARELGSRSITVNVVAPGFIDTDMTAELPDDRKEQILAQVPLARYGRTDDVANTVLFLTSDAGAYITGAVIPVDGGLGMGH
ncbi:MAG: 3-oxoacyl-[acyl-carrier-protein] reductase [Actinobacteria bacterium]|nr:3-oxoacyl-[acyl-carrier-protein] reductase [Actinomycetota bacterium]